MANIINGTDTGSGGLITTGDSSDELQLQTAETTAITITSGQQSAFIAGTASAPAVTTTGDLNTGIYFPAADNIGFATGGTIRGRWTTDGLCFGTDTAAANALDDYEEGTWTPAWAFATSGSATIGTINFATYTKVGQIVTVSARFFTSSISSPSGKATVTGLPFASADTECSGSIGQMNRFVTDMPNIKCNVNGSSLNLVKTATNDISAVPLEGSDFLSSASRNILSFSVTYKVA